MTVAILFVIGLAMSALYSGSETGVYAVNRLRLELRAANAKDRAARLLERIVGRKELLLCVLLLGNNIANELTAILAESFVREFVATEGLAALVSTALLVPLLFILGEALPKQLFRTHAETLTYRVARFLYVSRFVLWPLTVLVLPVSRVVSRWAAGRQASLHGFRHDEYALERLLVAGGSGLDAVRETAMSIGSSRLRQVSQVMIPLERARWLDAGASVADLEALLSRTGHARYPVREADGSFRSYVFFMDRYLESGTNAARPLARLAPDCSLDRALAELERCDSRVAVVVRGQQDVLGFVFAGDLVDGLLAMNHARPEPSGG